MNGFTFFRNYYEAINDPRNGLSEEEQGHIYNAIFAYMFDGEEPELEGACRMAFNLIKVSLDLSKTRSEAGRSGANARQTPSKPSANDKQTPSKPSANDKQTASMPDFACGLPLQEERRKKQEDRDETGQNAPAGARESGEAPGEDVIHEIAAYKAFLKNHPKILVDITNPGLISGVDWELLDKKIGESRILKPKRSLNWLLGHYREILGNSYRDFERTAENAEAEKAAKMREAFYRDHPWMKEGDDDGDNDGS